MAGMGRCIADSIAARLELKGNMLNVGIRHLGLAELV